MSYDKGPRETHPGAVSFRMSDVKGSILDGEGLDKVVEDLIEFAPEKKQALLCMRYPNRIVRNHTYY